LRQFKYWLDQTGLVRFSLLPRNGRAHSEVLVMPRIICTPPLRTPTVPASRSYTGDILSATIDSSQLSQKRSVSRCCILSSMGRHVGRYVEVPKVFAFQMFFQGSQVPKPAARPSPWPWASRGGNDQNCRLRAISRQKSGPLPVRCAIYVYSQETVSDRRGS